MNIVVSPYEGRGGNPGELWFSNLLTVAQKFLARIDLLIEERISLFPNHDHRFGWAQR